MYVTAISWLSLVIIYSGISISGYNNNNIVRLKKKHFKVSNVYTFFLRARKLTKRIHLAM